MIAATIVLAAVVATFLAVGRSPSVGDASVPAALRGQPWILVQADGQPVPVMLDDDANDYVGLTFGGDSVSVRVPCGTASTAVLLAGQTIRMDSPSGSCTLGSAAAGLFGATFTYQLAGDVVMELLDGAGDPAFEFVRGTCRNSAGSCGTPFSPAPSTRELAGPVWRLTSSGSRPVGPAVATLSFTGADRFAVSFGCPTFTGRLVGAGPYRTVQDRHEQAKDCAYEAAPVVSPQHADATSVVEPVFADGARLLLVADAHNLAVYRPGSPLLLFARA